MSGLTGTAIQVCARHATIFDIPYASSSEAGAIIQKLREAAGRFGRANAISFALRIPTDEIDAVRDLEAALRAYSDVGISEFVFDANSIADLGRNRSLALKVALNREVNEAPAELSYLHFRRAFRQAN